MTSAHGGALAEPTLIHDAPGIQRGVAHLLDVHLDVRALERRTGLSRTTVSELRRSRRRVSLEALTKVVRCLAPEREREWVAAWHRAYGAAPGPVVATPRQLPRAPREFVGREDDLAALDRAGRPLVVLTGMGGAGKTALALHWAHRHQAEYPDGCVFLDLHGFDEGDPLEPAAALGAVLRSLGVDAPGSADPQALAAVYRSRLAGRRLLLVLDNAHDSEQVRLLLPGGDESHVLVTSRDGLTELRDLEDAARVEVAGLPPDDALSLLTRLTGGGPDPAMATLAERCAGLPLLLRVAAGVLADVAGLSARELADELAAADGPMTAVVSRVLTSSYRHLDGPTARTLRLLARHHGDTADVATVAAMCALGVPVARRHLRQLVRVHLAQEVSAGRYGLHDLLRAYARGQSDALDPPDERLAAFDRVLTHYEHCTRVADTLLYGSGVPAPDAGTCGFGNATTAARWLDAERPGLVRYAVMAAREGRDDVVCRLSERLWTYLYRDGHHEEAVVVHEHAVEVTASPDERGAALQRLAVANIHLGRYDIAARCASEALDLARSSGRRGREGAALGLLGALEARRERNAAAVGHFQGHLRITRELADRPAEARVLNNLGLVQLRWGRARDAIPVLEEAVEAAAGGGLVEDEAISRNNLGLALQRLGRVDEALTMIDRAEALIGPGAGTGVRGQFLDSRGVTLARSADLAEAERLFLAALDVHRETGERAAEAESLDNLGDVLRRQGRPAEALAAHREATRLAQEIGEKGLLPSACNGAGAALRDLGDAPAARRAHERARDLAVEIGNDDQRARALLGLADHEPPARAAALRAEATALYKTLGLPGPAP